MSKANIVHSGYGLRCEKIDKPLNLSWGLDNSAVLRWPGPLPTGWLRDALDQIFIAAPQLSAVVIPWTEWREEPQALDAFRAGKKRHHPSRHLLAVTAMAEFSGKTGPPAKWFLMHSVRFISRCAPPPSAGRGLSPLRSTRSQDAEFPRCRSRS
ncbi:IucB [Klebsiella pneumoniae subsp. rhinoscleromatis]|nr:IucB [Klebsiella pneumoniae subsp. rhinoscleromatis]